ncbi:unnamed protein product [Rhizophagus irregularis]|nr:unnamed protein product [Rhizophagus irregularis]
MDILKDLNKTTFLSKDIDEIQHYLMEPLISHINEVNENSEEEILSAENDELANDDDNIYSDPSDPSEFHVDLDPVDKSIVQRHVFKCWKFGVNKPKKVENIGLHHDSTSGKTGCPWQVSFYLGKQTGEICFTKFVNIHNHQCDTKIELAPRNLRLLQSILDKIEHYTLNGRLGAGQQYDLLLKEFPQHRICKKNLYNAINKFRGVQTHDESDASTLFSYLLRQHDNDPDFMVISRLEGQSNKFTGLFWMTSQQHNELWPQFHDVVIHDNIAKTNRYEIALSLFVGVDLTQTQPIVLLYTDGDPAMIAAVQIVYPQTQHLLCIYHIMENVKKKARCKLHGDMVKNFIGDFYHMRNSYTQTQFDLRFNDMHYGSNPSVGLPSTFNTIFKEIDNILQAHLSPIPLSFQQINQVTESNLTFGGIIEHKYDLPQIRLYELILDISVNDFQKLWEFSYIATTSSSPTTPHYVVIFKDSSSICTCMMIVKRRLIARWNRLIKTNRMV